MKIYHTLGGCDTFVHGKEFPMGTIVLELDTKVTLVCKPNNFHQSRKLPLQVYCYIPSEKKWVISTVKGSYKEAMWKHYREIEHKNRKRKGNYSQLMKADRKHKTGGSGIRLDKENFRADKTFTDYECSKNPMHDFRRAYC